MTPSNFKSTPFAIERHIFSYACKTIVRMSYIQGKCLYLFFSDNVFTNNLMRFFLSVSNLLNLLMVSIYTVFILSSSWNTFPSLKIIHFIKFPRFCNSVNNCSAKYTIFIGKQAFYTEQNKRLDSNEFDIKLSSVELDEV